MKACVRNLVASSIVALTVAAMAPSASAAEGEMMHDQEMMQGQKSKSGSMSGMRNTSQGMDSMGPGMGRGSGMGSMGMMGGMGGGCPMGMMGGMGGGMGPMGMMGGMGGGMGSTGMMGGMGGGMGSMGMMGGMGGGMGPMGMMSMLDLSDAQINQLEKIQADLAKKQRALVRQMWDEQEKMADLYGAEKRDPAAIGKAYARVADVQRQSLEAKIEAENKSAAVLTAEQRAQMRRGYYRGMMGN